MTLPTGVSTFLIECLDENSASQYNMTSDSLDSYSSPETFRDDDSEKCHFYSLDPVKYKNSTLLDSSKAVTVDKIPQISNLSAILVFFNVRTVVHFFSSSSRKGPSNSNYSSSALSVSTTLAGKKLCKITAARERTPDLKTGIRCSSPLGPESKHDNQAAKAKKLKKKKKSFSPLEGGSSSFRQLDASGNTSARSKRLTAEVLRSKRSKRTDTVPLYDGQEICSIVRMSPDRRLSRPRQVPAKKKEFCIPKRVPEDSITSTKNWIYGKQR
ncbi:MEIKN protein, partial [Malurus elegans]|nr:MEIKN protein [Malurus elegans]